MERMNCPSCDRHEGKPSQGREWWCMWCGAEWIVEDDNSIRPIPPSKEPFPPCPRCSAGNRFVMQRTDDPDKYACRNCDHRFTDMPKPVTISCLPGTVKLFKSKDEVNNADHYGGSDNPYEVGKVLHAWGLQKHAYLWNVVKYVARRDAKGQPLKDLKKARFYLDCEIAEREGRNHWTEREQEEDDTAGSS